jgi:hypothetical protein
VPTPPSELGVIAKVGDSIETLTYPIDALLNVWQRPLNKRQIFLLRALADAKKPVHGIELLGRLCEEEKISMKPNGFATLLSSLYTRELIESVAQKGWINQSSSQRFWKLTWHGAKRLAWVQKGKQK